MKPRPHRGVLRGTWRLASACALLILLASDPPFVLGALPLPAWTHWLSAVLLTISVDATALYLVATRSAAQYAKLGSQGRKAVWFFYLLTAALNSLLVLSYTPGLPAQVHAITPMLSLLGAITADEIISPSIVRERLSCSETTAHKLLQEACATGQIERAGHGAYRVRIQTDPIDA